MCECWIIVDAGLSGTDNDAVAIYADDINAVPITHDVAMPGGKRSMAIRGSS